MLCMCRVCRPNPRLLLTPPSLIHKMPASLQLLALNLWLRGHGQQCAKRDLFVLSLPPFPFPPFVSLFHQNPSKPADANPVLFHLKSTTPQTNLITSWLTAERGGGSSSRGQARVGGEQQSQVASFGTQSPCFRSYHITRRAEARVQSDVRLELVFPHAVCSPRIEGRLFWRGFFGRCIWGQKQGANWMGLHTWRLRQCRGTPGLIQM